jgi:hypothetical protein
LHEKYGKEGLVTMAVALDDLSEKGLKDKIQKFLQAQKAAFTDLILDEEQEFWVSKFGLPLYPTVYVFNREGKWKRFKEPENFNEIEETVAKFLKVK